MILTGSNKSLIDKLDKQIKWGARACAGVRKQDHKTTFMRKNKIPLASTVIVQKAIVYFSKICNNLIPTFNNELKLEKKVTWNTRCFIPILPVKANSNFKQNCYIYSTIRNIQKLPLPLRTACFYGDKKLKKNLKSIF